MNGVMCGIIACELMGRPDAHMASIEMLDEERDGFDGIKIKIVDVSMYVKGPRKGRPNWRTATNPQERLISRDQLNTLAAAWSERTGLCINCTGTGRTFAGWRLNVGTTWRECKPCNGTGSADGVTPAATLELVLFEAAS